MGNIKSVIAIGNHQTYDLEVNHPDHQFYLSNGILTSNSHAVLYSMISYHTAYLKAHYPIEFLLGNLMFELRSNAKSAKDNIDKFKQELKANNIKILPPDINKSNITYELLESGELLTGFEALKSVGDDAIRDIIEKRPFKSFDDFMIKVDGTKVRSNTIQSLIGSGCLDCFGISRTLLYLYCSDYRKKLQTWLKRHDPSTETFIYPWPSEVEWTVPELYALEKSILDEAFICGKEEAFPKFFKNDCISIADINLMHDKEKIQSIRAEIKSIFEFKVKKETSKYLGQPMIKATIEDQFGDQITLTVFPENWKKVKEQMKDFCGSKHKFDVGIAIHFSGTVNVYEEEIGIVLQDFFSFFPPAALPKNIKAKKISKKNIEIEKKIEETNVNATNMDEFMLNIEDSLYDEGFIEFDETD